MGRLATMVALSTVLVAGCGGGADAPMVAVAREASLGAQVSTPSAPPSESAARVTGADGLDVATATALPSDENASSPAPTTAAPADPGKPAVEPTPTPEKVPVPDEPAKAPVDIGSLTPELRAIVAAALADAMQRTGRGSGDLVVIGAEAVVWSDGSLGCPEPGTLYTMALVPGYRVRIAVAGDVMDYHASQRGYLVYCPAGRAIDPLPSGAS